MSEMSMGAIWSSLPVPVLVIGEKDIISAINPAAEGFLNMSERALVGTSLWRCISINTHVSESFERARENLTPFFVNDVSVEMGPKSPVLCNLNFTTLLGMEGFMLLLIEPRNLAGRLTQTQSGKSAAKAAIGMAEMLAHEIKNPLSGIKGAAQLLETDVSAENVELTPLICSETDRVAGLVDEFEQFTETHADLDSPVNVHAVLGQVRLLAENGFGKHLRFSENYDPSLPPVLGNKDLLTQVFLNLVKNAAEAADEKKGEVLLTSAYRPGVRLAVPGRARPVSLPLEFAIIDNGIGVPEDIKGHLFDPFVTTKSNGTGLGLALVAKIIGDHGGTIECDSQPGRTTFTVRLPIATEELSAGDER